MRAIWATAGILAFVLGVVGAVLPLLPTTPFMILAAFCFARSSPRLHAWLLAHRTFGPMIDDWNRHRAIAPRAKKAACIAMAGAFVISLILQVPATVLIIQALVLGATATFILTRPDGPRG